jgi:hypothetical protein
LQEEAPINFGMVELLKKQVQVRGITLPEVLKTLHDKLQADVARARETAESAKQEAEKAKQDVEKAKQETASACEMVRDREQAIITVQNQKQFALKLKDEKIAVLTTELARAETVLHAYKADSASHVSKYDEWKRQLASAEHAEEMATRRAEEFRKRMMSLENELQRLTRAHSALIVSNHEQGQLLRESRADTPLSVMDAGEKDAGERGFVQRQADRIRELQFTDPKLRDEVMKVCEFVHMELEILRKDLTYARAERNLAVKEVATMRGKAISPQDEDYLRRGVEPHDSYPVAIPGPEDYVGLTDAQKLVVLGRAYNDALRANSQARADSAALHLIFELVYRGQPQQLLSLASVNNMLAQLHDAYASYFDCEVSKKLHKCYKCKVGHAPPGEKALIEVMPTHNAVAQSQIFSGNTPPTYVYSVLSRFRSKKLENLLGESACLYDSHDTVLETYDFDIAKKYLNSKVVEYTDMKKQPDREWCPISVGIVKIKIGKPIPEGKCNEYIDCETGSAGYHLPSVYF